MEAPDRRRVHAEMDVGSSGLLAGDEILIDVSQGLVCVRAGGHAANLSTRDGEQASQCSGLRCPPSFHARDQATAPGTGGGTLRGTTFEVNFSAQFTLAVVIIRSDNVTIAPTVMVSPVRPSKKKL